MLDYAAGVVSIVMADKLRRQKLATKMLANVTRYSAS